MRLPLHSKFLDEAVVLHRYDNRHVDGVTVEIYSVGVPYKNNAYTDIDTGIIMKIRGKEIYRNYKLRGYTIEDIVYDFQRKQLNESLGIR